MFPWFMMSWCSIFYWFSMEDFNQLEPRLGPRKACRPSGLHRRRVTTQRAPHDRFGEPSRWICWQILGLYHSNLTVDILDMLDISVNISNSKWTLKLTWHQQFPELCFLWSMGIFEPNPESAWVWLDIVHTFGLGLTDEVPLQQQTGSKEIWGSPSAGYLSPSYLLQFHALQSSIGHCNL